MYSFIFLCTLYLEYNAVLAIECLFKTTINLACTKFDHYMHLVELILGSWPVNLLQ